MAEAVGAKHCGHPIKRISSNSNDYGWSRYACIVCNLTFQFKDASEPAVVAKGAFTYGFSHGVFGRGR